MICKLPPHQLSSIINSQHLVEFPCLTVPSSSRRELRLLVVTIVVQLVTGINSLSFQLSNWRQLYFFQPNFFLSQLVTMHAWLWDDRREPDTRLVLHTHPSGVTKIRQAPTLSNKPSLRSGTNVGSKRKASDLDTPLSSRLSAESPSNTAALPPGSVVHNVHWTVLTSTSEYFKRRVTTNVGPVPSNGSSNGCTSLFKYDFIELLEVGQLEAAASVLQSMYTQEIAIWGGVPESQITHLLLMLQVQLGCLLRH